MSRMARPPTIKDVAKVARVSTATVSRTLKRPELVSPETRNRVLEAVRESNYIVNAMGRNLRRQASQAVLMVVRDMNNPFYLDVFRGVEAQARDLNFNVLMGNTEDDPRRGAEYFRMLRARQADGMILMTGKMPPGALERWNGDRPPVVVALEYFPDLDIPTVRIDNEAASAQAVEHLIVLGHRRIAHISGPVPEIMSLKRREGYETALRRAGLEVNPELIVRGDYTLPSGHAACRALFALDRPPTALFCANDEMAVGAMSELQEMGLSVPQDVSVVGFDDAVFARAYYPPLTTVRQHRVEIGRIAMQLMASVLAGEPGRAGPIIAPTELVVRKSTAPVKSDGDG